MPHHHAVRSLPGTLLWRRHSEARDLWDRIWSKVPDPMALCLMPDHIHLLHRRDVSVQLGRAMSGYARWRNHRRGESGPVWRRHGSPEGVEGTTKERRSVRYIHLNPCRAGLASDPLGWAWSTHRDRVGLSLMSPLKRSPRPHEFHAYVSGDPTVAVQGTLLPVAQDVVPEGRDGVVSLRDAVSATARLPWDAVDRRGPGRTVWFRAARCMSPDATTVLAGLLGITPRALRGVDQRWSPDLAVIARAANDPRFEPLHDWDLRNDPRWRRYVHLR